jgi:[histone H4]-lysine20 N-methyltransferase SETD8
VVYGNIDGLAVCHSELGRGVVATRAFHRGDTVVEYEGELISMQEGERREMEYAKDESIGSYMFFVTSGNRKFCIDATTESGKLGRLINHSRSAANLTPRYEFVDGVSRVLLVARQDISKGTELFYDYGDRRKKVVRENTWLKH